MKPENCQLIIFFTENTSLSDTAKKHLEPFGFGKNLTVTNSSSDLERVLRSGNVVLCLLDQSAHIQTVREVINISKKNNHDMPIVLITDRNSQSEAAELLESGADDYITTDNFTRLGPVVRREIKAYCDKMAGKKARQEVKELLNIIESAEDEIYIMGGESYKIKFANAKALSNLGYTMKELHGMEMGSIAEKIIPIDTDNSRQGRVSFRTMFRRKDGTKYLAEAVFQTAETEGNIAVLCIVHDITEKEEARKHAYVLEKAIDASATAITVTDTKNCIVYANRTQAKIAGKKREDMTGEDITLEPMYANSGLEFFEALKKCLKGDSWIGEYQKTSVTGEEYIVLGSVSPVFADGLMVTNTVIVEEDVTERVKIKSQLLHAQKMETVGELTSGIAHDFTNMLTAISGFASIMKRKMDKDSSFYNYVEKISELTVRAKSLTSNLMTFSRKQVQAESVICVNSLVKSVGEFLSMVIGSRVELKIEICEDELHILGDPVQLEQVIINLATNARDAIETDGELTICTGKTMLSDETVPGGFREYAVIKVKDNGCGIEPEKLEQIFEPFFTTKVEGKGTGLGLYIVSDIIERHHGEIKCTSEVGEGTEFVIKIPLTDRKVETSVEELESEDESAENICILLVEDEKVVRESLTHALDVYGYKVLEAVNGKEAVKIFKEKQDEISILITDIVMPVMNGITAYKEMAAIRPGLKAIFTTGYVGEAHRKDGFNEEEHVVMIKPLMVKDLIKNIEKMMKEEQSSSSPG